jgi:hypothetical protein
MKQLSDQLLQHPTRGTNLSGATLGENLEPGPTLVAFLRHFG